MDCVKISACSIFDACVKSHAFLRVFTLQVVNCFKVESDEALLPVDLTGNLIMIEKLVLGETWTGDLPIFSHDALASAPLRQAMLVY